TSPASDTYPSLPYLPIHRKAAHSTSHFPAPAADQLSARVHPSLLCHIWRIASLIKRSQHMHKSEGRAPVRLQMISWPPCRQAIETDCAPAMALVSGKRALSGTFCAKGILERPAFFFTVQKVGHRSRSERLFRT